MPVQIMGPLAKRLFDLGQIQTTSSSHQAFDPGSQTLDRGISTPGQSAPAPQQDNSGSRSLALANLAGIAASAYAGDKSGVTPPDEKGNGFGLGGTLSSNTTNEIGDTSYAGTQKATIAGLFQSPNEPTKVVPKDNGYRSSNPYAADYGQAEQARPSLFTYGGSYGGASY